MLGCEPAAVGGATTAGSQPNMSLYTFISESIPLSPTTPPVYTTSPHQQPHLYTLSPTNEERAQILALKASIVYSADRKQREKEHVASLNRLVCQQGVFVGS